MTDDKSKMVVKTEIAKPLHYQQLERSLNIEPFLSYVEEQLKEPLGDLGEVSSDSDNELAGVDVYTGETIWNGQHNTKQDRISDRMRLYNLGSVGPDRQWLQDVLLSDSSNSSDDEEVTEEDFQQMLKEHVHMKKYRSRFYSNPKNRQYQYYGAGLLSNYDKFPEHQSMVTGITKKKRVTANQRKERARSKIDDGDNYMFDVPSPIVRPFDGVGSSTLGHSSMMEPRTPTSSQRGRRGSSAHHKRKSSQSKTAEIMAHRRRKLWVVMAKKELGKVQRCKINNHKELMTSCKRVANYCMRHCRQKVMQSQKNMKEVIWRAKRLTREMQVYWKRYERVERETRRRMEKEAEEQRKLDFELMEAKKQQRKLNFLITQTELYAHFMSRKLGGGSAQDQLRILSQLDEDSHPRLAVIDNYDCETEKEKVKMKVERAFSAEEARAKEFGALQRSSSPVEPNEDKPQPEIFRGNLKGYQIKGMTWLVNLYDQGINGILADEMGLGKTVQSIAFLCHIAEKYSIWGPFLIISPASTLHNWQQEMQRFVPDFKVVPYWGNPQERRILRQFWDQKGIHTKDASFHVVITSYQLVITDFKYFNRIKWQYLILDEAQAIKSSSSIRWKLLLGFNCRNRLLLSGTPIQNSMAELWALLHFIMPTMFDSHDEFNEWFSKDIENHLEHKTSIDEKHLSRLHMILKPFMLRRVKMDVENELSDKIEIMVYCPLTTRQKMLYSALKKKIKIEDLLHSSGPYQSAQSITSNLMNLVMQFRKVCNHPELFERREPRSPLSMSPVDYEVPKLITDSCRLYDFIPSLAHLLYNKFSIFQPEYIYRSLFGPNASCCFSFSRLLHYSPSELSLIVLGSLINRLLDIGYLYQNKGRDVHRKMWGERLIKEVSKEYVFTSITEYVFTNADILLHSMPETLDHRILRTRYIQPEDPRMTVTQEGVRLIKEFPHSPRSPVVLKFQPVTMPSFLKIPIAKVELSRNKELYSVCRSWAWKMERHRQGDSKEGRDVLLYGSPTLAQGFRMKNCYFRPVELGGISAVTPVNGWSNVIIPDKQTLVTDAGKLTVLDALLTRLKQQGHRALIYSQMTRMIDILEEYMWFRKHTYMRLDGSSKISDRRDMVADFQNRADIFVFLLSTRAGGLGINLTAADTVIFYDSDWNPTVDQQAMDRAHRLGQTKQVTVYRLICKGTIEERILQRAQEKSEIQRMVISGGNFKPDTLKPKEVVSLLLDDEEIEQKYRQKQAERRLLEESRQDIRERERKRKLSVSNYKDTVKQLKTEDGLVDVYQPELNVDPPKKIEIQLTSDDSKGSHETAPSSAAKSNSSERPKNKRGRPPRNTMRGGLSRPMPVMPPIGVSGMSSPLSVPCSSLKRGPGRPRLKPVGPSHQGARGVTMSVGRGAPGQRTPLPVPLRSSTSGSPLSSPLSGPAGASPSHSTSSFNE